MHHQNLALGARDSAVLFSLLDIEQVSAVVGLRKTKIYGLMKIGDFPTSIALGERCVRWRSDEIQAWMEAKSAARGDGAIETSRQVKARKAVAARHVKKVSAGQDVQSNLSTTPCGKVATSSPDSAG